MDEVRDAQYEGIHRRLVRRAAIVTCASLLIAFGVLLGMSRPAASHDFGMAAASTVDPGPPSACTRTDLTKPAITAMPPPEVVASPLVIRPGPDLERLSPPDSEPSVSAARAWSVARRLSATDPSSAGSVQILLGDLYASTPAVVEPDNSMRPVFTHRLVWAIFGLHQPEVPSARSDPAPCYFESTLFYVDATTGRSLVAEVFPPPSVPSSSM